MSASNRRLSSLIVIFGAIFLFSAMIQGCKDDTATGVACETASDCPESFTVTGGSGCNGDVVVSGTASCVENQCEWVPDTDAGLDVVDDTQDDADTDAGDAADIETSDCVPGEYQCECATDVDCDSGICINSSIGRICSRACSDDTDCGDNWECRLLQTSGGDVAELCVPVASSLCNPCTTDFDCDGIGSLCNALTDGDFCTVECGDNDACPEGFGCETVTRTEDGTAVEYDHCLPLLGVCGGCLDLDGDGYGIGSSCAGEDCDDTLTSVYDGAPEVCDDVDNDCDDSTDEDFDLTSSPANCGQCGTACDAADATSACTGGVCEIIACNAGLGDCDATYANGCETDTNTSLANCGACGSVCEFENGIANCEAGVCTLPGCMTGFADCDADTSNGCEIEIAADEANCGVCGNVCSDAGGATECINGTCQIAACNEGFADCNAIAGDGCETNLQTNVGNCGTCGTVCEADNGNPVCVAGTCGVSDCDVPFADCDSDPSNGCEIALDSNTLHCGACDQVCAFDNGTPICDDGMCVLAGCLPGFSDCDGDPLNGCEIDLTTDADNCSACGTVCSQDAGTSVCLAGDCVITGCDIGFADCNGLSVDACEIETATDTDNCGACGIVCTAPNGVPDCTDGVCEIGACDPGFVDCNGDPADGCEVNITEDLAHCGACGAFCGFDNGVAMCNAGTCELAACSGDYEDCNGDPTDGCEVNLADDVTGCGTCGNVCNDTNATAECVLGVCEVASCDANFEDCNGLAADGCEVSLLTDVMNCATCDNECSVTSGDPACVGGNCVVNNCDTGFSDCDGDTSNGCETNILNDEANCGSCFNECEYANGTGVCTDGGCELAACDTGFEDCDGDPSNGCETNTVSNNFNCGACGTSCDIDNGFALCEASECRLLGCDFGWQDCDASLTNGCEADVLGSTNDCGACGNVCNVPNSNPMCSGGTCRVDSCFAGYDDCDNLPNNGCETDLGNSDDDCGACDNECEYTNGAGSCSDGTCELVACGSGFADCDLVASNGCEVALGSDYFNCGGCDVSCAVSNATTLCNAGSCTVLSCSFGYENCNNSVADGCEVSVLNDLVHCGGCGNVCSANNASSVCTGGTCGINACNGGFADCNNSYADGCETNLRSDNGSCGACGDACSFANGVGQCNAGTCELVGCASGFANCDGDDTNGCETDTTSDVGDCGACGIVCSDNNATPVCNNSVCEIGSCDSNFADCNLSPADGCEINLLSDVSNCNACNAVCTVPSGTPSCIGGACTVDDCSTGTANCDGSNTNGCEVNLETDVANCGSCGTRCEYNNGDAACSAGVCSLASCDSGYDDCNADDSDGCETDLRSNFFHCGACGADCDLDNATGVCQSGSCIATGCSFGFDNCDSNDANGCEQDILGSVNNCGGCDNVCTVNNGTPECASGVCDIDACNVGFADCDGGYGNGCEINLLDDDNNCGSCGTTCAFANAVGSCESGSCELIACNSGFGNCDGNDANGCETNLNADPGNCGTCASACSENNATPSCVAGTCTIDSCDTGFADCNASAGDGCEINLNADVNNCGTCTNVCTAPGGDAVCNSGTCGVNTCDPGFADCDGNAGNGCETNLQTDDDNCGLCGTTCTFPNGSGSCTAGTCELVGCDTGFGDCDASDANGCEVDLEVDYFNCGQCDLSCDATGATTACNVGECVVTSCDFGLANCNNVPQDGCEVSLLGDAGNCGACGQICNVANADPICSGGACAVGACQGTFQDCDGSPLNGCEANLNLDPDNCGVCNDACDYAQGTGGCASGTCGLVGCDPGYANCDANDGNGCEADLGSDSLNCGFCSNDCAVPNATSTCNVGACELISCQFGHLDCNGVYSDGCEVNILNDFTNCGACNNLCTVNNGSPICSGGFCAVDSCDGGFADCNGTPFDGCEVNVLTDANNCGACGSDCSFPNGIGGCNNGTCELVACATNFEDCDGDPTNGCEVNTLNDAENCSACDAACSTNQAVSSCSGGVCQIQSCLGTFENCNGLAVDGCEVNLQSDVTNCSSCGNVCSVPSGSPACENFTCVVDTCSAPFADCNGSDGDGCEINTNNDVNNCGACGNVCAFDNATATCNSGVCEIASCNGTFENCDNDVSNGCEANLNTDYGNCGTCGTDCDLANATGICQGGTCDILTCDFGYKSCDGSDANGCEKSVLGDANNCGECGTQCNDGVTCTADTCSNGACSAPISGGSCYINSTCYSDGDTAGATGNNQCIECNAGSSQVTWTQVPGGSSCNDGNACTTGDNCQNGICAGTDIGGDDYETNDTRSGSHPLGGDSDTAWPDWDFSDARLYPTADNSDWYTFTVSSTSRRDIESELRNVPAGSDYAIFMGFQCSGGWSNIDVSCQGGSGSGCSRGGMSGCCSDQTGAGGNEDLRMNAWCRSPGFDCNCDWLGSCSTCYNYRSAGTAWVEVYEDTGESCSNYRLRTGTLGD